MSEPERAPEIQGRTIRFIWADGPTAGKTHEHRFKPDGSVDYAPVENGVPGKFTTEKSYAALKVGQDVCLVSYLGSSGYTLTVALNFADAPSAASPPAPRNGFR